MGEHIRDMIIHAEGLVGKEPIAVLERSTGDHSFVAFHGITAVNRQWFWDALWPYGNVLLAGLPGHGPLPAPAATNWQEWTPQHFIEVGIDTVRQLGRGRPVTLIGHSTGGMISLGVAQQAPELVERLILIAPVVWNELTGIVGMWQRFAKRPRMLRGIIAATYGQTRRNKTLFWASLRSFIADTESVYANDHILKAVHEGYEDMLQTPIAAIAGVTHVLNQVDLRASLKDNPPNVPTLLIHGEQDPIVPFVQAQWLALHLPQIDFRPLPGVGHLPHGEREALVNQMIVEWCKQHPVAQRMFLPRLSRAALAWDMV
jgi:Predicted hydrolases or acyltransferases (alpha/beta hydrolase superfamily)